MALYEFRCKDCDTPFETRVPWEQKAEVTCPRCGSRHLAERFGGMILLPTAPAPGKSGEPASGFPSGGGCCGGGCGCAH